MVRYTEVEGDKGSSYHLAVRSVFGVFHFFERSSNINPQCAIE